MSSSEDMITQLKSSVYNLLNTVGNNEVSLDQMNQYKSILDDFLKFGGSKDDIIVKIGETFFNYFLKGGLNDRSTQGPSDDEVVEGSKLIQFDYLENFMKDSFLEVGVPDKEASICAQVLIDADKRGIDSHGIGRLKPIYIDRILQKIVSPYETITTIKETETTAFLDGNMGLGLYIGHHCMSLAIEKAKKYGLGFVVVKNSTHYGTAGYYCNMAIQAGCVGLSGTNARPSIAPTFGVEPCLGTNPLSFGVPTDEDFPFLIDCATSINQRGKLENCERLGLPTPKGVVIDYKGNERTDTSKILKDMVTGQCAFLPVGGAGSVLGGYKGYSWATLVELLSTAFQSGPIGSELSGVDKQTSLPKPMPLGHYFLAINIESIVNLPTFKENSGKLLRYLRNSAKDPFGPGRIWTAGEPEYEFEQMRQRNGGVYLPPALLRAMMDLRDSLPGLKEKYSKLIFEDH